MDVNGVDSGIASAIPEGHVAVPLNPAQAASPLRVCVLLRTDGKNGGLRFINVRSAMDATVLLGCMTDAAGSVHQWIELWIQNADGLAESVAAAREALSNRVLDERWQARCRHLTQRDPGGVFAFGWESDHPIPMWIDATQPEPHELLEPETAEPWRLCTNDTLLEHHGLPAYSTSLHRYLYVQQAEGAARFVAVTRDAPTNDNVETMASVAGDLLPLNPGGGLMLVQVHRPLAYDAMLDQLAGDGDGAVGGAEDRLFLGRHGLAGRLVETLHVKLRLLADAVWSVREHARLAQAPLLNLRSESFRVQLGETGQGLPRLWTARTRLVETGDAVALPIQTSSLQYFLRAGRGLSVYQPMISGEVTSGCGSLRIRKTMTEGGESIVEGTFTTDERVDAAASDLVWLRLQLDGRRIDLYGHLKQDSALAAGELRFRSVVQRLSVSDGETLQQAEGVVVREAPFDVIPLLTTPCDLYALGVLAVRTLLVDKDTTLPAAVDEILSLARQVAAAEGDEQSLASRVQTVVLDDARWLEALGPQRLIDASLKPSQALDVLPIELWCEVLATLIRMFPGAGADSVCQDFGDAPVGGLHKVFDGTCDELNDLIRRTRSLIVIDWNANREIHSLVRRYISGTAEAAVAGDA